MTVKEAWHLLEDAQLHLEKFIEAHGGRFDGETGSFVFPVVSQTAELAGLCLATNCIGDVQSYLEDLVKESGE